MITSGERNDITVKHNVYRKNYNVENLLKQTNELNSFAQQRADKISSDNVFAHDPSNPYGENLWATTNESTSSSQCVDSWMSESYSWVESENNWYPGLGHFSQCVWNNSTEIGIAKGTFVNDGTVFYFVVCNYNPPGNVIGERPYPIAN